MTGHTRTSLVAGGLAAVGAAIFSPAAGAAGRAETAVRRGAASHLDSSFLYTDPSTAARNTVHAPNPQVVPLTVRGAATHSVALQRWEDSGGNELASIGSDGGLYTNSSLHIQGTTSNGQSQHQPLMIYSSDGVEKWSLGLDSSDRPANDGFFLGRVDGQRVIDVIYVKSYGPTQNAVGVNLIPPPPSGLAVSGWDGSVGAPTLLLRVGAGQTGEAVRVIDSSGATRAAIRSDGSLVASRLRVAEPLPPARSSASGTKGDISWDAGYMYVCVARNRWRRAKLSDW